MHASNHSLRVVVVWRSTVVCERTFTQTSEPSVSVGEGERHVFDLNAPGLPPGFEMFERTAGGYRLRFTDRLEGTVEVNGAECSLEALVEDRRAWPDEQVRTPQGATQVYEMELRCSDWGLLRLGDVKIFFQLIEQNEVVAGRGLGSLEMPVVATVAAAALLHLAVLLTAFLGYEPQPALAASMGCERCWMELAVEDVQDPLEVQEDDAPSDEETSGKRAGGEEGKVGVEDEERVDSEVPKDDGELVEEIDPTRVGVLEALADDRLGQGLEQVFAKSDGIAAKIDVASSGDGDELDLGRGAGGMGLRGLERGGGDEGHGRLQALGGVDTGGGSGPHVKLRPKQERDAPEPHFRAEDPLVGDFCDKGNIRRVVAAKANAVKYCYERQLQQAPELEGKVVAQWKIGLDGKVTDASIASSTLGDRAVESCIARTISRMRFERPKGGICVINYPFVFSGIE